MGERAKVLLAKASDDLDLIKDRLSDNRQRDNVGFHLSMALEKILKALCEIENLEYSRDGKTGHDLQNLFEKLVDNGQSFLNDYADLLALEEFDSQSRYFYTDDAEKLDLAAIHGRVMDLFGIILKAIRRSGWL